MKQIYVMVWNTESSDSGLAGYWTKEPTQAEIDSYICKYHTDDFEAGTFYYHLHTLSPL